MASDRLVAPRRSNHEAALMMCVAEKYCRCCLRLKSWKRLPGTHDILVFIRRRAMDHLKFIYAHGPLWKAAQKLHVFRREYLAGPKGAQLCPGIEILSIGNTTARFVVVAADYTCRNPAHPVDCRVRVRAISHQIAQANDLVIAAARELHAFLEAFHVRVDV